MNKLKLHAYLVLLLMSFVLIAKLTKASPALEPATIRTVLLALERADPVHFRFRDLTLAQREKLVEGVLETMAKPHLASNESPEASDATRNKRDSGQSDESFVETFRELKAGKRTSLLALVQLERRDCTKKELKRRGDVCASFAAKPEYRAFCQEAHRRSANWCERPTSIEGPFADLLGGYSLEPPTRERAMEELEKLEQHSSGAVALRDLLKRAEADTFDRVVQILRAISDKTTPLTGRLSATSLLALISMDASQCVQSELVKRRTVCQSIPQPILKDFCLEAFERSVLWCRKSHLNDFLLSNSFWKPNEPEHEPKLALNKIHWLSQQINPMNLRREQMLDWQNREMFECIVKVLARASDKNEQLVDRLVVGRLLEASRIDEIGCSDWELHLRCSWTFSTRNTAYVNYLKEIFKRSIEFCGKRRQLPADLFGCA